MVEGMWALVSHGHRGFWRTGFLPLPTAPVAPCAKREQALPRRAT